MLELFIHFLGLIIVLFGILLLVIFNFLARRGFRPALRPLGGFDALKAQAGQAMESGGRVHVSFGSNSLIGPETAVVLGGLTMLDIATAESIAGDRPPVATTADATTLFLISDTIRRVYSRQGLAGKFEAKSARLVALDPVALAGGATGIIPGDGVQANVLIGSFGPEVALMAEAGVRRHISQTIGSDRVEAQAIGYVMADHVLIGEELYAARAYLTSEPAAIAGLAMEDVLRWFVIGLILFGAILQTLGLLR